ncbi:MAG: hypothetical protein ACKOAS_07930 [Verrucomicrobiota bacterium]
MSFRIQNHAAAACPTLGAQERQAHGRCTIHRAERGANLHPLYGDSGDGSHEQAKSSLAIRRAQDCLAVLGDALGLLQTQDEAIARLQSLESASLHTEAALICAESFNGLPVFSQTDHDDPIWIENIETPEAVEVPRPPVAAWLDLDNEIFRARLAEAHDANRRAQVHIEQVLEANRVQLLAAELAPHQLARREEAAPCVEASRQGFLAAPREALLIQANSAHAAVLRLFE